MNIAIVRDRQLLEQRVPLSPGAASALVAAGHKVFVESGAGASASFTDDEYARRGATVVYSAEEAFGRGDIVVKVKAPTFEELDLVQPGAVIMSFLHLAMVSSRYLDKLLERRLTAVGFEIIRDDEGELPVLSSVSEIAGSLSIQIGASLLQSSQGGRGILLNGAPGVAPANVLVLGAGTAGSTAARRALQNGARVLLVDRDIRRLRRAERHIGTGLVTGVVSAHSLADWVRTADLLIGAVLVPGGRSPVLVARDMVASMPRRSVIIDLAIDQGGCVETSRPTTLSSPTFIEHEVVHHCVPNVTSCVARTSSFALSHALYPYVAALATAGGMAGAPRDVVRGTYTHDGRITHRTLAELTGRPRAALELRSDEEGA